MIKGSEATVAMPLCLLFKVTAELITLNHPSRHLYSSAPWRTPRVACGRRTAVNLTIADVAGRRKRLSADIEASAIRTGPYSSALNNATGARPGWQWVPALGQRLWGIMAPSTGTLSQAAPGSSLCDTGSINDQLPGEQL